MGRAERTSEALGTMGCLPQSPFPRAGSAGRHGTPEAKLEVYLAEVPPRVLGKSCWQRVEEKFDFLWVPESDEGTWHSPEYLEGFSYLAKKVSVQGRTQGARASHTVLERFLNHLVTAHQSFLDIQIYGECKTTQRLTPHHTHIPRVTKRKHQLLLFCWKSLIHKEDPSLSPFPS